MLKILLHGKDGLTPLLGLSAGNWEELRAGNPIMVRLREISPQLPNMTIILTGGDTEADIMQHFENAGMVPKGTTKRAADMSPDDEPYVWRSEE